MTGRGLAAVLGGVVLGILLPCGTAAGQGLASFSLSFDNDGLSFWIPRAERSDWFYTHGTRLEVVGRWRPPLADALGLGALPACRAEADPEAVCLITRIRLVHQIYTPQNLFFYTPFGPDRPYAGWLSATVAGERVGPGRTTTVSVELGVSGDPSLARPAHVTIHRMLEKAEPRGWEYEIPFEVAGAISFRDEGRVPAAGPLALAPHWQATLGTLRTSAGAGLAVHMGWNADREVEWAGPPSGGVYLRTMAGVEGEYVVRDLFLDGSTWRESARTSKEPLVGRLRFRLLLGRGGAGLQFGITRSTPEFADQGESHQFATVGLTFRN